MDAPDVSLNCTRWVGYAEVWLSRSIKTKRPEPVQLDFPLFWCPIARIIMSLPTTMYHVIVCWKRPIAMYSPRNAVCNNYMYSTLPCALAKIFPRPTCPPTLVESWTPRMCTVPPFSLALIRNWAERLAVSMSICFYLAFVHWACYFAFNASRFLCHCCEYTFLTLLKFLVCMQAGNARVPPAR